MIIPVYHVVSSVLPIASTTTIEAGMAVGIDSGGYAIKAYDTYIPLGLAGDKVRSAEAYEWQNRVSDFGREAAASGMLSVYHSGGEFYVDVDDSRVTTPAGTAIRGIIQASSVTTAGTLLYTINTPNNTTTFAGQLYNTSTNTETCKVAVCLAAAATLDGGIPGEYEPLTTTLASDDAPRTWVKIKLII